MCPVKRTINATADKGVAIQQQRIKSDLSQFVKILGFLSSCDHVSDMHRYCIKHSNKDFTSLCNLLFSIW